MCITQERVLCNLRRYRLLYVGVVIPLIGVVYQSEMRRHRARLESAVSFFSRCESVR